MNIGSHHHCMHVDDCNTFDMDFEITMFIGVDDHAKLKNRDLPDQHSIEAITGLSKKLGDTMSAENALTNAEIFAILQT